MKATLTTLTTLTTCDGPAATRAGVAACLVPGCWWSGEAPDAAEEPAEPIEGTSSPIPLTPPRRGPRAGPAIRLAAS